MRKTAVKAVSHDVDGVKAHGFICCEAIAQTWYLSVLYAC